MVMGSFCLQHVFQWELDEYKKEGVKGKDIKFTDNRPLIDMFLEVSAAGSSSRAWRALRPRAYRAMTYGGGGKTPSE